MNFHYYTQSGAAIEDVDFVGVDGTESLGRGGEIIVSVYLNRDLDDEFVEHYFFNVTYTKNGGARTISTYASIANLKSPSLTFGNETLKEGEDKEIYGFLSYPIDYPGWLSISSQDVSASSTQGDYTEIDTLVRVEIGSVSDPFAINASFDLQSDEPEEQYVVLAKFHSGDEEGGEEGGALNVAYPAGSVTITDVARGVTLELKEEKIAYILAGDDDFDQVLDMYDLNGGPVRQAGDRRFVPIELVVSWDDTENSTAYYSNAKIKFLFNEAKGTVEVQPGSDTSKLTRLWKKQWDNSRDFTDRISNEIDYSFQQLGIVNGEKVTIYLEALTTQGGAIEVLADISAEVTFPEVGSSVGRDTGLGNFGPGENGAGQTVQGTGKVRYRQLPDKFDNSAPDFVLANHLNYMYQQLYSPDGAPDPIRDFLDGHRNLSIQVRERYDWRWQSPIFAPDRIGNEPLNWVITIDRSTVLSKGPVWGVAQIRNLIFASLGTQQSQVMTEYYSKGANNFESYHLEGGRVEEIKARFKLWSEALQSSIDTFATVAYATAEIGISFVPGGDVLLTAINLANMESIPDPKSSAIDNAALAVQVVGAFVPFVPNWAKKAGINFGSGMISFLWKKVGNSWDSIAPSAGKGASAFSKAVDNSFYNIDNWCFASETLVHSCHGSIPIESIQVGQNVKAFDFDNQEWVCCSVQSVHRRLYTGPLFSIETGNPMFRATTGHPVFVVRGRELASRPWPKQLSASLEAKSLETGRWVNTNDLLVGDVMIGVDGCEHVITAISVEQVVDEPVFNLTVQGNHTFAVGENGLLVHNESWCEYAGKSMGLTNAQLKDLRQEVANLWGKNSIQSTHGHHIVHKAGAATLTDYGRVINDKSHGLINGFGVETVTTYADAKRILDGGGKLDNLCIAPYSYVHSDPYVLKVNKMLVDDLRLNQNTRNLLIPDGTGGWKPKNGLTPAEIELGKAIVKNTLAEIRDRIPKGQYL